jgi:hypothetical protein
MRHRAVVNLEGADADRVALGQMIKAIADGHDARPQRPGDEGAPPRIEIRGRCGAPAHARTRHARLRLRGFRGRSAVGGRAERPLQRVQGRLRVRGRPPGTWSAFSASGYSEASAPARHGSQHDRADRLTQAAVPRPGPHRLGGSAAQRVRRRSTALAAECQLLRFATSITRTTREAPTNLPNRPPEF